MRIYRCGCLQFMKIHKIGGDGYDSRQYTNCNNTYISIYSNCASYNYYDTVYSTNQNNQPRNKYKKHICKPPSLDVFF